MSVGTVEVFSSSPEQTRAIAAKLAAVARPGDVLVLIGDVGTGKTTFAQGFADGLGVAGVVTSPTFTLVRPYTTGGSGEIETLLHADLYRLDSLHDVLDLGLDELIEDRAVALVEWGEVAARAFGPQRLEVCFSLWERESGRKLSVSPHGQAWSERIEEITEVLYPWISDASA
jgi:tRNA threonylcarbamoyladenosine biosynthesis protein TsaE